MFFNWANENVGTWVSEHAIMYYEKKSLLNFFTWMRILGRLRYHLEINTQICSFCVSGEDTEKKREAISLFHLH